MFSKNYTGALVFISVLGFIIIPCTSLDNAKATKGKDLKDDDFVPYQGRRFDTFDWNFWKAVTKNHNGNMLVSPVSIKLALILLYEGAQNQTAHELSTAMNLPASRPATRDLFSSVLRGLKEVHPEYILNVGTRMYIDSSIHTRQRYYATVKAFYETDVKSVNFSDTRAIANDVNNWVNNLTHGNIEKLIEDENRLSNSVALITSALFFKGTWKNHPFLRNMSQPGKFIVSLQETINVNFMQATDRFYFCESADLNAKILRIPYKGQKYAMYFVLPNAIDGVNQLTEKMNSSVLSKIVWLMEDVVVDVKIPRFKFESTNHLEESLREVGIREIFSEKATLVGIARAKRGSGPLYVSDIVHKAGIEVNEDGTSAYSTTEIQIGNKNSDESFYAEHPFMFYIEDESTGTIVYVGKVSNPLQTRDYLNDMPPVTQLPSRFRTNSTSDILGMSLTDRYNYFNVELIQKLYEEQEGNVIVSPASVKAALMILIEGTDGRTRQELLSALRLPTGLSIIRSVAHSNLASLKSSSSAVEVDAAIRFWTAIDVRLSEAYKTVLQRYYESDVSPVDFRMTDNAVAIVNSWVQRMTRNHVKTIVDSSTLDPATKILVTSAIYFKSQWQNTFIRNRTKLGCFRTFKKECHNVFMMESIDTFRYANVMALDTQVLEIPYSGKRFSFLVMLPNKPGKENLDTLSRDLSYIPIPLLLRYLEQTEIELQMPKFSVENKFHLKETLKKLGIKQLFSPNATFSKSITNEQFFVNDVVQNAKIVVNEDGTEAAAITGLTIVPLMASSAVSFQVNRPFLYFIIDLTNNNILFSGKLVEP